MSSMGRKEGIVVGEVEPYWFCSRSAVGLCGSAVVAVEVCGRVNSSNRSASLGWCMWMYEAEESLLWVLLIGWFGVCSGWG